MDTSGVEQGLANVERGAASAGKSGGAAFAMLDRQLGGVPSKLRAMASGFKTATGSTKAMNLALKASPIFLLVGVIASLVQAFRASEEGQNKFNKIMLVINTTVDNFLDVLADVGEMIIPLFEDPVGSIKALGQAIVDNIVNRFVGILELVPKLADAIGLLFEGEFSQAAKVATDAFGKVLTGVDSVTDSVVEFYEDAKEASKEFAEQVTSEAQAAARVADMRAKADKIDRQLLVDRAKIEAEMADARLKAREDDKYTAEERRQFLLDAQKLEDELLDRETEALQLRADAQTLQNTFARSNKEALDAEAEAIAAVEQVQARRLTSQRAVQREVNRLNGEIERSAKEAEKATAEAAKAEAERLKELIKLNQELYDTREKQTQELEKVFQTAEQNELDAVARKYDELALYAEEHGYTMAELIAKQEEEYAAIRKKYDDKEVEDTKKKNDEKVKLDNEVRQKTLGMAANAFGALMALNNAFAGDSEKDAKKQFDRNKRFQTGQAIIQTAAAVTAALTAGGNPIKLATGAQFVEAGIAAALGLAQVATIQKTQFESGTPPPANVSASSQGSGQGTPGPPRIDGFGLGGPSGNTMIRSYVIGQEVTSQQQAIQLVNDQASLNQGPG